MSDTAAPIRYAPIALWRVAQAFLGTLHMLFGAPEDVAADHTLTAKAHKQMAQWLRCAEALLRRLLAIEASAHAPPAFSPQTAPAGKMPAMRVRKLISFYPDKPEDWRVTFRCFASPTLRQAQGDAGDDATGPVSVSLSLSKANRPEARRFYSAWPLAERYEALIRVFNDPTAYARRLSRRLHATPHRLCELLRAPPEAEHRIDDFEACADQVRDVWRPHFSSA